MSKSSDSITAAKLLAKARAENYGNGNNLRINSNFSKSIQNQLDVYSKTKEEIQQIRSLAKVGSDQTIRNIKLILMKKQKQLEEKLRKLEQHMKLMKLSVIQKLSSKNQLNLGLSH